MMKTCANGCQFATLNEFHHGHFECTHPATVQITNAMWGAPDFPEDDGKLPENTPAVVSGTKWLGHPKDCKAYKLSPIEQSGGGDA